MAIDLDRMRQLAEGYYDPTDGSYHPSPEEKEKAYGGGWGDAYGAYKPPSKKEDAYNTLRLIKDSKDGLGKYTGKDALNSAKYRVKHAGDPPELKALIAKMEKAWEKIQQAKKDYNAASLEARNVAKRLYKSFKWK